MIGCSYLRNFSAAPQVIPRDEVLRGMDCCDHQNTSLVRHNSVGDFGCAVLAAARLNTRKGYHHSQSGAILEPLVSFLHHGRKLRRSKMGIATIERSALIVLQTFINIDGSARVFNPGKVIAAPVRFVLPIRTYPGNEAGRLWVAGIQAPG